MREIKFRAWEHNLKEMIVVDDIQFYRGDDVEIDGIYLKPKPRGEQPIMINTRSAWRIADGEDVTLMQYTGLKDKNGKEICEGDILKHIFSNQGFPVVFKDGKFCRETSQGLENPYWEDCEIIGNIYETPELLTPPTPISYE